MDISSHSSEATHQTLDTLDKLDMSQDGINYHYAYIVRLSTHVTSLTIPFPLVLPIRLAIYICQNLSHVHVPHGQYNCLHRPIVYCAPRQRSAPTASPIPIAHTLTPNYRVPACLQVAKRVAGLLNRNGGSKERSAAASLVCSWLAGARPGARSHSPWTWSWRNSHGVKGRR